MKNIFKELFTKNVPYTFYNGVGMQTVITRGDALDFYKSWVFACVMRRANSFAQVKFKLYRKNVKGELEEVKQHQLIELLHRPNPEFTGYNFFQLTSLYKDLYGSAPIVMSSMDKRSKKPNNIWLIRPDQFKQERDKEGKLIRYVHQVGGYRKEYSPDEVMIVKNPNPRNPERGMGILEAVRITAENDDFIMQSNNALLKNGARPSGILKMAGKADIKLIKKIKQQFKEKFQGMNETGDVPVLPSGMTFEQLSLNPKDLDYLAGRKFNRDEICAVFGVPLSVLGLSEDVNLANAKSAEYNYHKWTITPNTIDTFEQLNKTLVPLFGDDLYLWFDDIVKEDRELILKEVQAGVNVWLTPNEVRAIYGKEPLKNGDYIYQSFSSIPVIGGGDKKSEDKNSVNRMEGNKNSILIRLDLKEEILQRLENRNYTLKMLNEKVTDGIMKKLALSKKVIHIDRGMIKKKISDEARTAFYENLIKTQNELEKKWEKSLKDLFEKQKQEFVKAVKDSKSVSTKDIASQYGINVEEQLKTTINIITPLMYETMYTGVQGACELLGEEMVIDVNYINAWLEKVSEETGKSITQTTVEAFEKAIAEGASSGSSIDEIASDIEEILEFAKGTRATMIARTETVRGITEAHRQTYEEFGFKRVAWLLENGACLNCEELSKKTYTTKEATGMIPVHPNCRCGITPIE